MPARRPKPAGSAIASAGSNHSRILEADSGAIDATLPRWVALVSSIHGPALSLNQGGFAQRQPRREVVEGTFECAIPGISHRSDFRRMSISAGDGRRGLSAGLLR